MPSKNLRDGLGRRIQPRPVGAGGAGEHQRQPGRAVLQIVQRLRVGRFRIGMVDPLHDLPGRGRGAAGDRGGALGAAIDRLDLQAIGRLADQLLERRALQHPVDQLAPVLVGGLGKILAPSVSSSVLAVIAAGCSLVVSVIWPEIATGRPPSQTVVGVLRLNRVSGSRFIPSVERCASASRTRRPAMTRSGAISASGTSTKARSNSPWMRQRQFGLVEPDIVVGDQVEVEGARDPSGSPWRGRGRTSASILCSRGQRRVRIEAGFDLDAGVGEGAWSSLAPRAGWCNRRNAPAMRACVMPQMWEMAFAENVARTSPTLPPSAISTSAMSGRLPLAHQHHADILEDRGDRRMRLVHGDLDRRRCAQTPRISRLQRRRRRAPGVCNWCS